GVGGAGERRHDAVAQIVVERAAMRGDGVREEAMVRLPPALSAFLAELDTPRRRGHEVGEEDRGRAGRTFGRLRRHRPTSTSYAAPASTKAGSWSRASTSKPAVEPAIEQVEHARALQHGFVQQAERNDSCRQVRRVGGIRAISSVLATARPRWLQRSLFLLTFASVVVVSVQSSRDALSAL